MGPLLHWVDPDVSNETIALVQRLLRKAGHLFEYAVLAMLTDRSLRQGRPGVSGPRVWTRRWKVLAFCFVCAAGDELRQSTSSVRMGSSWDVLLDFTAAGLGLLILQLRARWKPPA